MIVGKGLSFLSRRIRDSEMKLLLRVLVSYVVRVKWDNYTDNLVGSPQFVTVPNP